jgi:hypothetical protein
MRVPGLCRGRTRNFGATNLRQAACGHPQKWPARLFSTGLIGVLTSMGHGGPVAALSVQGHAGIVVGTRWILAYPMIALSRGN